MSRLSAWLAGAADPVRLAKQVGMEPDPWQQRVLRSTANRLHLNCSRQVGKSTVTAIMATYKALYTPGATVLIISPSERQSSELFLKVQGFYKSLGKTIEPTQANVHTLALENGSRILSLPASESGIRGFTAALILVDEAAYVPDSLFTAVSPMLAVSGGRMVAMSTPAGRRGWWYEASLSDRWERVRVPATECPRISADFLAEERDRMGETAFRAEYMCEFIDAMGAAFSGEDVEAMFSGPGPGAALEPTAPSKQLRPAGGLVVLRHMEVMERRRAYGARVREREQRRCQHRWRQGANPRCVWCGARQSEQANVS